VAFLRLWDYLRESQHRLSGNAFRRMCRDEFLHYLRVREWQDLHTQLKQICRELDLHRNEQPAPANIHVAALAGLLSHVGLADLREDRPGRPPPRGRRPTREYLGARGTRFAINPGSSVAKTSPPLVMAAEIVETNRLWARTVAPITAEQVEEVGEHLLKRSYSEPHWSARSGAVMAYEQVSLYGIPIIARRPVGYGRINPAEARAIFIRSALVEGQWRTRHHFYRDNELLRRDAESLEERTRRRDLLVDDDTIFAFYDARLPAEVTSVNHFDAWWKTTRQLTPHLLQMTMADLTTGEAVPDAEAFPEDWVVGGHRLPVDYVFEPGHPGDGVTVTVPVSLLNQLRPEPFSWQVEGLRAELATELLRTLPKSVRRQLVPAPDYAARALAWLDQEAPGRPERIESLPQALGRALRSLTGENVAPTDWQPEDLPAHLRVTFRITQGAGDSTRVLASGKDLGQLAQELAPQVNRTLNAAAARHTRTGLSSWDFGPISEQVELNRGGHRVVGYPALVDEQRAAGVQVFDTPERQSDAHRRGLRRLLLLNTPDPTRWVVGHLNNTDKLALAASPYPSVPDLLADARLASVGELARRHQNGVVRDAPAFQILADAVRADNADLMRTVTSLAAEILRAHGAVLSELPRVRSVSPDSVEDLQEQLGTLVFSGFLSATPFAHLVDLPRYLQAARARTTTLLTNPTRDRAGLSAMLRCEDAYAELTAAVPPGPLPGFVADIGWLLEELRVSLFAQQLGTPGPVSTTRIKKALTSPART